MAVFGVGAYYDRDISNDFIQKNLVGVGWDDVDAPELKEYFTSLKVGDIVYIKSAFGGNDITVKAIGIITDHNLIRKNGLVTTGRNVKWLSTDRFVMPRPQEKNNVRSNTVYEEFHPKVLNEIISRIR
jgi:hypothetical protein